MIAWTSADDLLTMRTQVLSSTKYITSSVCWIFSGLIMVASRPLPVSQFMPLSLNSVTFLVASPYKTTKKVLIEKNFLLDKKILEHLY